MSAPGGRPRSSSSRVAGSRRRAPRAGTIRLRPSTRSCRFVNRELGWTTRPGSRYVILRGTATARPRTSTGDHLRVLEVGAREAWAARFWLERSCEFFSSRPTFSSNDKIGPRLSAFYGDFGRVQADGPRTCPSPTRPSDVTDTASPRCPTRLDLPEMVRGDGARDKPAELFAGLNEGIRGTRSKR